MTGNNFQNLREKLNSLHNLPFIYLFKFIVKEEAHKQLVISKFKGSEEFITVKPSSKGNFQSISVQKEVQNAEEVIEIYEAISAVPGIMIL